MNKELLIADIVNYIKSHEECMIYHCCFCRESTKYTHGFYEYFKNIFDYLEIDKDEIERKINND